MSILREVLLAFRPKTLTAALVPCVAATAYVAARDLPHAGWIFWCAVLSAMMIQIGTNLVNDAADFVKGADTEERVGPRRITAAGVLAPRTVWLLAGISFLIAVALGVPLVMQGGWPIIVLGLVSVAMGYSYTAGPFPLAYLGLGDLFVILFFGLIAVGGLTFLHAGALPPEALWLGLQIGFHSTVLIAINNLRDRVGDAKVGKRTLAVRFGAKFSRIEITALAIAPFLMNIFWWTRGDHLAALLPLLALPFAVVVIRGVWKNEPGPVYNRFLGLSAALHLVFGLMLSLGWWLG